MKTKSCLECGIEFMQKCNRQLYCSRKCFVYHWVNSERGKMFRKKWEDDHFEHRLFCSVRARCNSPKDTSYNNYGKLGIKCLLTYQEFKEIMKKDNYYEMKLAGLKPQVHRIDPKGNYEKDNIKFLSNKDHYQAHRNLKIGVQNV